MENKKENSNIVGNEILIYQTKNRHIKIYVKMKLSGLRRYNYVNYTKLVNLISVSILNIFLKKGNCKKKQCANL